MSALIKVVDSDGEVVEFVQRENQRLGTKVGEHGCLYVYIETLDPRRLLTEVIFAPGWKSCASFEKPHD